MNITILTVGSRGDVQPFVALGLGLQAAGYQVVLATHAEFEPFISEHGLGFAPIPGNPTGAMRSGGADAAAGDQASSGPEAGRPFKEVFERYLAQWMQACLEAATGSDVIIYSQLCFIGAYIAERLQVPCFAANHSPITPTGAWPTIYQSSGRSFGPFFNRLTHVLDQQLFWQSQRSMLNRLRASVLGLPPLPFFGPYAKMEQAQQPVLYSYSPAVVARPADWGAWIDVTGYWFLDQPAAWQPPADLVAFLAAGPPPIYLGLGSITDNAPARVMHGLLAGLAEAGQRVIVLPGKLDLASVNLPRDTYIIGSTAFDWLFPQVAGVICHGGPGTLSYALRAGVPTLSIPFFGDQPFWGRRTHQLGVAAAPIAVQQVSAARVAAAVPVLLAGQTVQRARALGQRIQAEDGVALAVRVIQQRLATWPQPATNRRTASSLS